MQSLLKERRPASSTMIIDYVWESFRVLPGRFVYSASFIYLSNHLYQDRLMNIYTFYNTIQHDILQYYFITQIVLALETHIYTYVYIHTHRHVCIYIVLKNEVNRGRYVLFSAIYAIYPLNKLLLIIS